MNELERRIRERLEREKEILMSGPMQRTQAVNMIIALEWTLDQIKDIGRKIK